MSIKWVGPARVYVGSVLVGVVKNVTYGPLEPTAVYCLNCKATHMTDVWCTKAKGPAEAEPLAQAGSRTGSN